MFNICSNKIFTRTKYICFMFWCKGHEQPINQTYIPNVCHRFLYAYAFYLTRELWCGHGIALMGESIKLRIF